MAGCINAGHFLTNSENLGFSSSRPAHHAVSQAPTDPNRPLHALPETQCHADRQHAGWAPKLSARGSHSCP